MLNPKNQRTSLLKLSWESSIQGIHERSLFKILIYTACFLPSVPLLTSSFFLSVLLPLVFLDSLFFSLLLSEIICLTLNFYYPLHFILLSACEGPHCFFYFSLTRERGDLGLKRSWDWKTERPVDKRQSESFNYHHRGRVHVQWNTCVPGCRVQQMCSSLIQVGSSNVGWVREEHF